MWALKPKYTFVKMSLCTFKIHEDQDIVLNPVIFQAELELQRAVIITICNNVCASLDRFVGRLIGWLGWLELSGWLVG